MNFIADSYTLIIDEEQPESDGEAVKFPTMLRYKFSGKIRVIEFWTTEEQLWYFKKNEAVMDARIREMIKADTLKIIKESKLH